MCGPMGEPGEIEHRGAQRWVPRTGHISTTWEPARNADSESETLRVGPSRLQINTSPPHTPEILTAPESENC